MSQQQEQVILPSAAVEDDTTQPATPEAKAWQLPLSPADIAMFERFRIPPEVLLSAGIRRVTDTEARRDYGIRGSISKDMSGVIYPYFDLRDGHRVTARVRRDRPEEDENGKQKNKYISAYGDRRHLFFGPGAGDQLRDPETPAVLVESEKSVLTFIPWADRMQRKIVPVGLGGCWSWRGRIGLKTNSRGKQVEEEGPLPDLACCDGRTTYLLLDSNVSTNRKVKKAQNALVRELKRRQSEVLLCRLPPADGVNGPDDYIAECGDEEMARVLDEAVPARKVHDWGGGQFEVSERGVEYTPPPALDKDGNLKSKEPSWLCSRLDILAKTRNHERVAWGRLLEWQDEDGEVHTRALPLDSVRRDGGTEALCLLESEGLTISAGKVAKEYLPTYLRVWPSEHRARGVDRPGWASAGGKMVYVLHVDVIGESNERVVYQNVHSVTPAVSHQGTADEWKLWIATPARDNSRLTFGISCAFAGPLLELAGEQSGGFHLRGRSSSGKTTALEVAASVWGHPEKYLRTWRATASGLEGIAIIHNDGLLILDELSQVDAREAGEAAYMLANGMGKSRAARNGMARPTATWRLLFLSAGEQSLAQHMANIGRKPTVGQELRMAEIDADAGAGDGKGVVEELHFFRDSREMIEELRARSRKYYGAVGRAFLEKLVADRAGRSDEDAHRSVKTLTDDIRKFVTDYTTPKSGAQVERAARRFALVGMAGELATTYGLTGWQEGEALKAAATCFVSWQNIFGDSGNREERQLLEQVQAFFEKHGSSRFEDLTTPPESELESEEDSADQPGSNRKSSARGSVFEPRVVERAGYYRSVDGVREYLVLPVALQYEVCKGFDFRMATRVLKNRGWLTPGKDRSSQSIYVPRLGLTTRLYVFGGKMWEEF